MARAPRHPVFLSLLVLLVLAAAPATAGVGVWTSHGPEGANFLSLIIDPSNPQVLYAQVTDTLLVKSTDGGRSWAPAARGLAGNINSLLIDPTNPAVLYAGSSAGIFRTTDGAASWSPLYQGAPFPYGAAVIGVDPSRPSCLYARVTGGLFRSIDGGASWIQVTSSVESMAFDSYDPDNVLAVDGEWRLLRSRDGGATWTRTAQQPIGNDYYLRLAFDPGAAGVVWAFTLGSGSLYRSGDGGDTWTQVLPPGGLQSFVALLLVTPGSPSALYLAGEAVHKSLDGGRTWRRLAGAGLPAFGVANLAADPVSPTTLYATTWAGAYRSTDDGASWAPIHGGLLYANATSLALDPADPRVLFAGILGGGIARSADGGRTWQPANPGVTESRVAAIAVDPSDSSVVWASAFRSADGGRTWERRGAAAGVPTNADALAIDPRRSSTVWISDYNGLYRTLDDGATWQRISFGLFRDEPGVHSLLIDPTRSAVYAGTQKGILRSTDGGDTWTLHGAAQGVSHLLGLDPRRPSTLYASNGGALFKSTDGGDTWKALPPPLPIRPWIPLRSLVVDPSSSSILYLATGADFSRPTAEGAVLRSTDGGLHWSILGTGQEGWGGVNGLALAPGGAGGPATLFAASFGGVYDLVVPAGPPAGSWLTSSQVPGFRFKVRITAPGQAPLTARMEGACPAKTLCASGAVPGQVEVLVRILGPKPSGYYWVEIVRFTTAQVEVWIEQAASGASRSYLLPAVARDEEELSGRIDRTAFRR